MLPWAVCNWWFFALRLPEDVHNRSVGDEANSDDFLEFVIGDVLQDQVLAYTMLQINIWILFIEQIYLRWPEILFSKF